MLPGGPQFQRECTAAIRRLVVVGAAAQARAQRVDVLATDGERGEPAPELVESINPQMDVLQAYQRSGAPTIAQDEATSIVFGMPNEAIKRGAVDVILPLQHIAESVLARAR